MLKTLNFVKRTHFFQSVMDVVALALALLVIAFCYYRFTVLQQATEAAQAKEQISQTHTRLYAVDEHAKRNLELAQAVQADLNLPWMDMLNAIETIKKQTPKVEFISIDPNKKRSEIRIKGEAKQFEQITQLIELLSKTPIFSDVALLNQHVEQVDGEVPSDLESSEFGNVYVFEISMRWHV